MLSPDPVIQWCVEEGLAARLRNEDERVVAREAAIGDAHRQAQRQLAAA